MNIVDETLLKLFSDSFCTKMENLLVGAQVSQRKSEILDVIHLASQIYANKSYTALIDSMEKHLA